MRKMPIRKPLLGKRFGTLAVAAVAQERTKDNRLLYECLCDCGATVLKSRKVLIRKAKFCNACLHKSQVNPDAGMKKLYNTYKRGARRRNYSWELSEKFFKLITSSDCKYCNEPPKQQIKGTSEHSKYTYNGIDRVDNSIGYIETNCVSCCMLCNRAKSTLSATAFLAWIKRVYKANYE